MAAVLAQQHRQQPMGAARSRAYIQQQQSANRPPLSEITCFKVSSYAILALFTMCRTFVTGSSYFMLQCGEKGHFANRCNKTGMSFLSSSSWLQYGYYPFPISTEKCIGFQTAMRCVTCCLTASYGWAFSKPAVVCRQAAVTRGCPACPNGQLL
jgi:hypothetical protein